MIGSSGLLGRPFSNAARQLFTALSARWRPRRRLAQGGWCGQYGMSRRNLETIGPIDPRLAGFVSDSD